MRSIMKTLVLTLLLGVALFVPAAAKEDDRLATIHLPEGFVIEAFAEVPNARQMAWGEKGTLFVGTRRDGRVFAVTDEDGDGRGERVREVASGLRMPSGVAFRDGALYVAAVSTILRFDDIEARLDDPPAPAIVTDRLPTEGHHGWKVLEFGPDGLLYFPVGAPCDVCRTEGYHGTILWIHPDGSGIETYARGLRNSVGLAWHPVTGELWFTDNGSDHLGPELPPDELNRAPGPGLHYGFPFCHAGTLPDPEFGGDGRCGDTEPPVQALAAHVAPLGLAIHSGTNVPQAYRGAVFIAEHGPGNRSGTIGYRVSVVRLGEDHRTALDYAAFAQGWYGNGRAWGRPADILEAPDGSILVSDDRAGRICRIRYIGRSVGGRRGMAMAAPRSNARLPVGYNPRKPGPSFARLPRLPDGGHAPCAGRSRCAGQPSPLEERGALAVGLAGPSRAGALAAPCAGRQGLGPEHHREAITSRPLLLHGIARQTRHGGQTRLTVTSSHGRRGAVVAALRRIASFFRSLVRSAEQLSAEDRWRRILAEALKKYLRGRQPGRQPWLPPPRTA